jgi:hypothetical protein
MAFPYSTLYSCLTNGWQISIGDPNGLGWAICAGYALAAVLAVIILLTAPFAPVHHRRERVLWGLIAGLMAAIALNKQLDLQTLLVTAGRCLAKEQGWYEDRRLVQRDFILALIAGAALAAGIMLWLLHGIVRQNLIALLGLTALALFIITRGGHLFHIFIPEQLPADYLVHALSSFLEILSPTLIIGAAGLLLHQGRRQPAV